MSAKSELFNRLKYLDFALQSPNVIDNGIGESDHNGAANLLRKGLGIVSFNILEDFIKAKVCETLNNISDSGIKYTSLPEKLQEAATLGAIKALAFRAKVEKTDGRDWQTLIHEETKKIHSTRSENFKLSKLTFLSEASNINHSDIPNLLTAFSISGGWSKLKNVSDQISGGIPDLAQAYKNAADRRHNAAHTADFKYEYSWISNIKNEIVSIAAALDILLTCMCRLVENDTTKKLVDHDFNSSLKFRYLIHNNTVYKEKKSLDAGAKTIKNWTDIDAALAKLKPSCRANNEFLVILNNSYRIVDWFGQT